MLYLSTRTLSTTVTIVLLMDWHLQLEFIVQLKTFYRAERQQCDEKQHSNWHRGSNLKISQKQRSRLEGVELDKPVSSIYSRPPEAPDVQSVAALGQPTLKFKQSHRAGVGSICSSGSCCAVIPLYLHTSLVHTLNTLLNLLYSCATRFTYRPFYHSMRSSLKSAPKYYLNWIPSVCVANEYWSSRAVHPYSSDDTLLWGRWVYAGRAAGS